MQEFLKNEQDKYIYYYNENELEQFYLYQQMPENNEINLNNKQEFFKKIFREWKLKQLNFLLQQISLDIQTYLPEKLKLTSSLTEIEVFRSILNSKENADNLKSLENTNLSDPDSCKNPNFILNTSLNNIPSIQGNNSVQINERKNFTQNYSNNIKTNNNNNNANSFKEISFGNEEYNKPNFLNTVSINDIANTRETKLTNCDNNYDTSKLATKEIDFSFFSNRNNTEKLISFLQENSKGIEKVMLFYVQEELEKNAYLRNESIDFLLDIYNSISDSGNSRKAESVSKSKLLSSTNYRKLLENQNGDNFLTPKRKICSLNASLNNTKSFENQDLNAYFNIQTNTSNVLYCPDTGFPINCSQDLKTFANNVNKKEPISSKNDYTLLGKRKSLNQKNVQENKHLNLQDKSNYSKVKSFKATSLQRNNLSLFPILEDDEIRGETYS